jgi:hypothetical protein
VVFYVLSVFHVLYSVSGAASAPLVNFALAANRVINLVNPGQHHGSVEFGRPFANAVGAKYATTRSDFSPLLIRKNHIKAKF